ncbi:MAG: HU family DNA-binding protein [Dysgonamonadaceae bacterium]|jgi:nucleoid DNA-binding protein/nucleoid-associated protein YgaU|nr:HU family DNA-binding protein [Dysgonamonadaceae bacterium]
MNQKINFQELISLLTEKAGIKRNEAENFLREFFNIALESITTDRLLRIKNLGTFKLVDVESRESVNINTGERVIIPAHKKLSYSADENLSKIINEPFAMFSTVDLAQQPTTQTEEVAEPDVPAESTIDAEPDDSIIAPEASDTTTEEIFSSSDMAAAEVYETADYSDFTGNSTLKTVIIALAVLILLGVAGYFAFPYIKHLPIFKQFFNKIELEEKEVAKISAKNDDKSVALAPTAQDSIRVSDTLQSQPPVAKPATTTVKESPKVKKWKMKYGERLTLIALREYGHKAFWVYLYEENKNIIDDPGLVPVGLEIVIPPASKYQIDKNNPESVNKAKAIAAKLE